MLTRTFLRALIVGGSISAGDRQGAPCLTVDADLLDAADLDRLERVEVSAVDNRWSTTAFLLRGPSGSGTIRVDGSAVALITDGEQISVISWAHADRSELATVRARIVAVDRDNRVVEVLDLGLVDDQCA
jgi:aspartate 1-decarboxylase